MSDELTNSGDGQAPAWPPIPLPRYRSHKVVGALKVAAIETVNGDVLIFDDARFPPRAMTREYMEKHEPQAGGYLVVCQDGYESWSPAEAFESGYAIEEVAKEAAPKKKA